MQKPSNPKRNRRQPVVLQAAQIDHPNLAKMPTEQNSALLIVAQIFSAPPDLPNLQAAAQSSRNCVSQLLSDIPEAQVALAFLDGNLMAACVGLHILNHSNQPVAMAGRRCEYRQWDLITRDFENQPPEFTLLVGVELVRAYLLEISFSQKLAEKLLPISSKQCLSIEDRDWRSQ